MTIVLILLILGDGLCHAWDKLIPPVGQPFPTYGIKGRITIPPPGALHCFPPSDATRGA